MPNPASPELLRAERQFARARVGGIILLGLVAVVGPLLSYRSDVQEMRGQFQEQVSREARVYAESLGLHLQLLESQLTRVATSSGVDLQGSSAMEDLQDLTAPQSGLFRHGVLLVDAQGQLRWSDPQGLLEAQSLQERRWFQRVLATQQPSVDALGYGPASNTFLVAVPVLRAGRLVGVLAGLLEASRARPGNQPLGQHEVLLVLNPQGDLFVPLQPPAWARTSGFPALVEELLAQGGGLVEAEGRMLYAEATPVPNTELRLVLAADESQAMAAIRGRLLLQLLVIALLQLGTLLLSSLYGRRVYRLFLEVERRAAAQERMAALGTAASLIAHEVKNSLNGMKAALGLLAFQQEEQGQTVRALRGQIDRLAHLARSLLDFGRPPQAQATEVDMGALVQEVLEGLRALPEAEEVQVQVRQEQPVRLWGDPLLLATAVDNLVRNAMEAAVAAKDLGRVDSPQVRVAVRVESGHALVEVEDNAGGPPAGFEERLFEPFVTSKPKGVGLGLAMSRQAVEQQGGHLAFHRIADGSRFSLALPLRELSTHEPHPPLRG
jgi:signal transduction histidine kinase